MFIWSFWDTVINIDDSQNACTQQFQVLFTLFTEFFSPVLHSTCLLSVFYYIFSLGRTLSPLFILHFQAILLFGFRSISAEKASFIRDFHPLLF